MPVSGYAENNFCQSLAISLPERVAQHSINGHQQLRHFVIRQLLGHLFRGRDCLIRLI